MATSPSSHQASHQAADFFVIRTPLLPSEVLTQLSADLRAARVHAEGGDLAGALAADREVVTSRLRAHLADPLVRDALFLASPSLDDAIEAWLHDPTAPRAREVPEILSRYLTRMSARPTPFGLFSGSSTGVLGSSTRLVLGPRTEYRRHTRLDTQYLAALCTALHDDEALRDGLVYRPSTGLYVVAGQLRYAEARVDPATRERNHHLVSIDRTPFLDAVLARAEAEGGARLGELADVIVQLDASIAQADAETFVRRLVERQILVTELEPPITGGEPLAGIMEVLRACDGASRVVTVLEGVERAVLALDSGGLAKPPAQYRQIATALRDLPAEPEMARLFQVDLYKPAGGATLGGEPLRELERAVELIARIAPAQPDPYLERFKERFSERYGESYGALRDRKMVPLALALDEESGVGFGETDEPSTLLRGLDFPPNPAPRSAPFGPREQRLVNGLVETLRAGRTEWALEERDVASLTTSRAPLPDALALVATLVADSQDAIERGEFELHVPMAPGPSGAKLFGRFCHGDATLRRAVETHLRAEEALHPEAIFAEVVHLPGGRAGNMLCRPVLRAHEITFLGRSGALAENQIPLGDLDVTIDEGRIVLWSRRLGREIVPRLTSAQNFDADECLGAYRFLCALQTQGVGGGLSWTWGPVADAPFLPRVTFGRLVLFLARWAITKKEMPPAGSSAVESFRAVQALRARLGLPRWVAVADPGSALPIDLDNVVGVESLLRLAKARDPLVLTELLAGDHDRVASGAEGSFVHELVVPFIRRPNEPEKAVAEPVREPALVAPPAPAVLGTLARKLPPGSEWLFAKLYVGTASADAVLSNVVAPLVHAGRETGAIDRWFFIRYGDPRWHLRVRLRGDPARLAAEVLPRLHELVAPCLADGSVWRVELGTYDREVERYGGEAGIDPAEALFEADSDTVTSIVALLDSDEGDDARWRLALRGCHLLLTDLGLDLATRMDVVGRARASFGSEHHVDKSFEGQLGKRFRAERPALEALLATPVGTEHPLDPGFALLGDRSRRVAVVAEDLRARERAGQLTTPIPRIAWNYLHMHTNRLLCAAHRAQELVLYDWLLRLYESESARQRGRARAAVSPR